MENFGSGLYNLSIVAELEQGGIYKKNTGKSCIEKIYTETNPYSFYVVDPSKHAKEEYILDSLYTKNKILKEFNLTGLEIKNSNFVIEYP